MLKMMRLDKLIVSKFPQFSRSKVQDMLGENRFEVGGKILCKSSTLVDEKSKIELVEVELKAAVTGKSVKFPKHSIEILYEDNKCMVIEKPAGISVHPGDLNYKPVTIIDLVKEKLSKKFEDKLRSGVVHRLDKDTSGVLIIAKDPDSAENLISQFKTREIKKVYSVLVFGVLQHKQGIIDSPIARSVRNRKKMALANAGAGRNAVSKYKTLGVFRVDPKYQVSLLEVQIMTGRTHQIRVHMAAMGHPVIGDGVYGNKAVNKFFERRFNLKRQFLHAQKIQFISPLTKKSVSVESELAEDLKHVEEALYNPDKL